MYQLNLSQQKRDVLALSGLNKKNTISLYRSKVRMFIKFCMLIGDAESTLIFLDNSPAKCPSANSRTVALFLRWKVFEKGTLLLDLDNTSTVKDVNGEDMKNVGDWNENNSINQFLSAVTTFHVQNDQSGGYLDVCSDCLREWSSNSSSIGCMQHAYKRKIIRGGNPRNSKEVKQMLGIVNKETENHVVRGAYQLIPIEMRAIRKMLLSTNKIEDLQCWVMILISVKLYLRAEEVCTIRLDHFLKEWFVIDEVSNKVKALALKIKGKTDEDWLRFFIYRSDDCPEFCAMRHLLVYLHCCNIEGDSGWLFPNLRCRQNHVSYASFLRVMKTRFTHLLNRRLPLTCHSLRKTGYLFAIWGDARIEVIRIDARHTCLQTSLSYEQDAVSMLAYAQVQSDENAKFEVPRYKAVRIINQAVGVHLTSEVREIRNLSAIAESCVLKAFKVSQAAEFFRSPLIVIDRAEKEVVDLSPMNSLRDLMRNFLPTNKYNDAIAVLGQLVRSNECDESEEENEVEETVTDNVGGTTKRKRKEGNDDLSEKDELKNMKVPIEKLNYIFELHKVVVDESRVSCFTNAARVYYN